MSAKDKKPKPEPKPSEPIQKIKDKTMKDKLKKAKKMENMEINAQGSITAGTWVAEFDTGKIRKNTLRTGE